MLLQMRWRERAPHILRAASSPLSRLSVQGVVWGDPQLGRPQESSLPPRNPVSFPCRAGCRPRGLPRGLTPGPCPLSQGISSETPYRTQTCTSWPGSCTTGRMRSAHSCWQESITSAGRVGGAMEALLQPFCDVHSSWGSLRTWAPPLWVEGTPSQQSPPSPVSYTHLRAHET